MEKEIIETLQKRIAQDNYTMEAMKQWIAALCEGADINDLLLEMGYKSILIYGSSYLGYCLDKAIDREKVNVLGIIDAKFVGGDNYHFSFNEKWPEVDAIIVSSINYFIEIRQEIEEKKDILNTKICNLDDFLFQM